MQILTIHDPARAREYFEAKMAFTTGPVELDRMIKSGENINLIDVREPEDFAKGHIPGAINLPKAQWDSLKGLAKDKTNVVYCYTVVCHLAAAACVQFASQGFPVMELDGGFEQWKENDMDIERESLNRLLRHTKGKLLHKRHE
jgi:rhodanese-related sulfurtransferase